MQLLVVCRRTGWWQRSAKLCVFLRIGTEHSCKRHYWSAYPRGIWTLACSCKELLWQHESIEGESYGYHISFSSEWESLLMTATGTDLKKCIQTLVLHQLIIVVDTHTYQFNNRLPGESRFGWCSVIFLFHFPWNWVSTRTDQIFDIVPPCLHWTVFVKL